MEIHHRFGLEGAAVASGPTIVIDVFRAFSAAAYAFAAGAKRIVLAEGVDEAIQLAATVPGAILMGEDGGVRPDAFDLGNSPGEIVADPGALDGKTIVHRSSSGTRCARAALSAGAEPSYVASLVIAAATVRSLEEENDITIVAAGLGGVEPAEEDQECADLLEALFRGRVGGLSETGRRVAASDRAQFLQTASFTHPDDIRLCTIVDRFDFAMRAKLEEGRLVVRSVPARDNLPGCHT